MTNTTSASIYTIPVPSAVGHSKKMTYALWTAQVVLALLFLFAGGMKLVLPIATVVLWPRFIGRHADKLRDQIARFRQQLELE